MQPMKTETTEPKAVALGIHARLQVALEHGKALRDVVASIAASPGSEQTIRAALRLLVRAYDEGISDV
jgi:hypothetical protein